MDMRFLIGQREPKVSYDDTAKRTKLTYIALEFLSRTLDVLKKDALKPSQGMLFHYLSTTTWRLTILQ